MFDTPNGILLVDKPSGMTSHDVVNRLRRIAGTRQIGHTGTLDPMATGLLMACIGPATRVAQFLVGMDKVYRGRITLGAISDTYDAEGKFTEQQNVTPPDRAGEVENAMADQRGRQIQLPPPYSAVKVGGKKLYEYARAGEPVPQKPREITVHRFELLDYAPPTLSFEARVSSGAYIRSMAHQLGVALGCGGYLSALRRTAIGSFSIDNAIPLDELMADPDALRGGLLTVAQALAHMPKVVPMPEKIGPLLHGQGFTTADVMDFNGILQPSQPVLAIDERGRALAIMIPEPLENEAAGELGAAPYRFRPMKVLAKPE